MDDWFVTALVTMRDMARLQNLPKLAERMEAAVLVAASERVLQEPIELKDGFEPAGNGDSSFTTGGSKSVH